MQHLVWASRVGPNSSLEPIAAESYGLLLVTKGRLTVKAEATLQLQARDVLLVPFGTPLTIEKNESADVHLMKFCGNCLQMGQEHSLLVPFRLSRLGHEKVLRFSAKKVRWLVQIFEQIEDNQGDPFPAQYEVLKSLLLLVFHEICLNYPVKDSHVRSLNVDRALQMIEQNYTKPLSLTEVAEQVHWSAPYLANKLKAETGKTLGQWLQLFRLSDASSQLIHEQDSVAQIADSVGYNDVSLFINHFKRMFQLTPAAWRKTYQAQLEDA